MFTSRSVSWQNSAHVCYMSVEEDGYALLGRTVAELKFTADEFDVLPLNFNAETLHPQNSVSRDLQMMLVYPEEK